MQWFESYLSSRQQYVSVNGHTSDKLVIKHGVPQGSVLGPLLFLLYINDLPTVSKKLTFYLFADDTNIHFESSDLLHLQKTINKELRKVWKWLESNRLALNIDKTNFVLFHSAAHKLAEHIVLKIGKKKIKHENHVCFLGVLLDSNLSWKTHLNELSKKLSRTVGLFYKIRHYAALDTLVLLYHGLFAPSISYGVSVWGLTYPSMIEPVFVIQKKIMKVITCNEMIAHSIPIFDSLQILRLNDVFQLQLASFVYECVNNLSPLYFRNYFTAISSTHSIGTRQSKRGDLFVERTNTTQYGIRSIHFSGARLWNSLLITIRESPSLPNFRNKLKSHFLLNYKS